MRELAHISQGWNTSPEAIAIEHLSFEEFFEAERDRLFRALCVISGNRQEAEDISQEAFARIWERWNEVGGITNPAGYLHRIAMNEFRSRYRRMLLIAKRTIGSSPEPDAFGAADDRHQIAQALASLTTRQRAALVLTEVLGYSSEEAGRMLGVQGSTIRALNFQARAALKRTRETTDV